MKKVFLISLLILAVLIVANPVYAQITDGVESIKGYEVEITVNPDSSLSVEETIVYDFGANQRHGIFRQIPVKYETPAGNRSISIDNISVYDGKRRPLQVDVSTPGKYKSIRIGDPDVLVTGEVTYEISYTVTGALNYYDDHDELYWNVTGEDWEVNISRAEARVILPNNLAGDGVELSCYAGYFSDTTPCDSLVSDDQISFTQDYLYSGQGLTIAVGFPKGLVSEPSTWEKIVKSVKDNLILLLPFLTLAVMWRLWYTKGRDPQGAGSVVAQYEPPDALTPAEVGTIVDERVNPKDTSAIIVDLAVRGYLKIKQLEKSGIFGGTDYELTRLKQNDLANSFERTFFDKLFSTKKKESAIKKITQAVTGKHEEQNSDTVRLSDLKNVFYKTLAEVQKDLYEQVTEKGYFDKNPSKVRTYYTVGGTVLIFLSFIAGGAFGGFATASIIAGGIIVIAFGVKMPKATQKGARAKEQILGLKEYLSVAEKDRIRFHNAPDKSPERFEKLLPYAMVFGVEKEWAKQFEGLYQQEPSWYQGRPGSAFTSIYLISALSDFNRSAGSTLSSTPRGAAGGGSGLGGGGFSGGGFGGGGGGSW